MCVCPLILLWVPKLSAVPYLLALIIGTAVLPCAWLMVWFTQCWLTLYLAHRARFSVGHRRQRKSDGFFCVFVFVSSGHRSCDTCFLVPCQWYNIITCVSVCFFLLLVIIDTFFRTYISFEVLTLLKKDLKQSWLPALWNKTFKENQQTREIIGARNT